MVGTGCAGTPESEGACGLGEVLGLDRLHSLRMPGSVARADPLFSLAVPQGGSCLLLQRSSRRRAGFKDTVVNLGKSTWGVTQMLGAWGFALSPHPTFILFLPKESPKLPPLPVAPWPCI